MEKIAEMGLAKRPIDDYPLPSFEEEPREGAGGREVAYHSHNVRFCLEICQ